MATFYRSKLLPNQPANHAWREKHYPTLLANKQQMRRVLLQAGIDPVFAALFVAMASIERWDLSLAARDTTKDGRADRSENVSIFNINEDMLRAMDYTGDIHLLNAPASLAQVASLMQAGIFKLKGVVPFLTFIRAGRTGYLHPTGHKYARAIADYLNGVATILRIFDEQPEFLDDDRRVEMQIRHI